MVSIRDWFEGREGFDLAAGSMVPLTKGFKGLYVESEPWVNGMWNSFDDEWRISVKEDGKCEIVAGKEVTEGRGRVENPSGVKDIVGSIGWHQSEQL